MPAMKFTHETHTAVTVRHVEQGRIRVGQETVTDDVILFRDSVATWRPPASGEICESDLAELIALQPEIIIFGCGWEPALPPRDLVFALARKGIGFEMMDTPAACRTFNILISEDRDAAAVLKLS